MNDSTPGLAFANIKAKGKGAFRKELEAECRNAGRPCEGDKVEDQLFLCGERESEDGPIKHLIWLKACLGPCLYVGRPKDDYCPGKW
jgi:hypothetical protein